MLEEFELTTISSSDASKVHADHPNVKVVDTKELFADDENWTVVIQPRMTLTIH